MVSNGVPGHPANGSVPTEPEARSPASPSPRDDAHAPPHAFPSLLHPPPRSGLGRAVYALEAAYNRVVASLAPTVHLRQFPLPSDGPSHRSDDASHERGDADRPRVPPPNPATVFSHLTQHDTLARLDVPTNIVHDGSDDASAGDESDSAGLNFAHLQHGLAEPQVLKRRETSGPNSFAERERESPLDKLLEQLGDPMILLLLASAAVSFAIGQHDDAVSITLAIVIVVTVGWVQEQRSEKSLEALNSLVPNYCHLVRPISPTSPDAPSRRASSSSAVDGNENSNSDGNAPPGAESDALGAKVMADELVPGDVVTFSTGDRIPADVRLFQAVQLEVDESTLTGEITPRKKSTKVVSRWPLDQVERRVQKIMSREEQRQTDGANDDHSEDEHEEQSKDNIVFMGTMVKSGHGRGVVIGTGLATEFGSVFSMVDDVDEKRTPLQRSMDDLAKKLTLESFGVIAIIFIVGFFQHRSLLELATIAISLAVAAIPEGLPIVVTVTLALGVLRMSKRNAIVKRLPSVETLGSVSVICTDKTGTLTENHMTVVKLYTMQDGVVDVDQSKKRSPDDKKLSSALARTLLVGNICNRAVVDREGSLNGSPTEVAMIDVLTPFGWEDRRHSFHQTDEVPFDTNWKYMTVVGSLSASAAKHGCERKEGGYTKGAPEAVLARCSHTLDTNGKTVELTENLRGEIGEMLHKLSSEGLRVLATATGPSLSKADHDAGPEEVRKSLTFCGLHALQDPPRKGVKPAIEDLSRSGVHIVMVTGDAPTTAVGIAKQLGILHHNIPPPSSSNGGDTSTRAGVTSSGVMTGSQVDQMSAQQLREIAPSISVFARTTPRHKMAIVSAFQEAEQVVAMTGDGVNDAPALKMADIGIAMGASGTDVAKEAADVILVDDNFVTILNAVEEGKAIFGNIQNFLAFQLSTSVAALFLILLSIMFGLALPLNAMQVLLINLACDGPPAQSLGVDPADASVFSKPPRPKNKPVLDKRVLFNTLFSASIILVGTLFVYVHETDEHGRPDERDMAMTFVTFVSLDLITAVQSRGLHVGLFANTVMSITISVSYAVLVAIIYFPPLQAIFQTIPLGAPDILYVAALTGITFAIHGLRRSWQRRRDALQNPSPEDIA